MKKYFKRIFRECIDESWVHVPYKVQQSLTHNLFSYIGISRLEKMIAEAKQRDEKYVALAELFGQVMRENLSKENSDIIHNYHELIPKLNQYQSSLEKVIKEQ